MSAPGGLWATAYDRTCHRRFRKGVEMSEQKASPGVLLRVEQVADVLCVSKRTVWRLVSGGRLAKGMHVGRCRRWLSADVEDFVRTLRASQT